MTHDVNRWHCHPNERLRNSGDTINLHQARVADLCDTFAAALGMDVERAQELNFAALNHDEAEKVIGDMPGPAKDRFPVLAAEYAAAEKIVLAEMGLHWDLTNFETAILHLADKLDAELLARRHGVVGSHDCDKLQSMADDLGLGEIVRGMMG
jgi:5'-deoxynucleotidase YfbR-like HD superfamily hydrolase